MDTYMTTCYSCGEALSNLEMDLGCETCESCTSDLFFEDSHEDYPEDFE